MNETFMSMALEEAKKGIGRTSPNPCVGAVIVQKGTVIGKGYHKKAGTPHAEINALNNAPAELIPGATMYVTLEPCSHTGKTPPCCEAIVEAGIDTVVIGMGDPNPVVNGNGIDYLQQNGVKVFSGVLEKQCTEINHPFIKYITTGLPWLIMKSGVSLDGRLNYQKGRSGWITGDSSGRMVHTIRNQVDAILVGRGTVEIDDPSLTTRIEGVSTKDPIRIVLDTELSTSTESKIFHLDSSAETWVVCSDAVTELSKQPFVELGARIITIGCNNGLLDLKQLLGVLGENEICSVLIEGGPQIYGAFLRERLIDYAYLFYAPLFAGDQGVSLVEGYSVSNRNEAPRLVNVGYRQIGEDLLVTGMLLH